MAPSCAARCQQWCWTSVCGGCWAKLRISLRGRLGWEGDKGPISCSAASIPMVDLHTFVASNSSSLLKSTHIFFEHHHFSCQFRAPYVFFSTARPGTLQSLFRCAPCPWSWTWCYCLSWIICTWCRPSSRHGCQLSMQVVIETAGNCWVPEKVQFLTRQTMERAFSGTLWQRDMGLGGFDDFVFSVAFSGMIHDDPCGNCFWKMAIFLAKNIRRNTMGKNGLWIGSEPWFLSRQRVPGGSAGIYGLPRSRAAGAPSQWLPDMDMAQ